MTYEINTQFFPGGLTPEQQSELQKKMHKYKLQAYNHITRQEVLDFLGDQTIIPRDCRIIEPQPAPDLTAAAQKEAELINRSSIGERIRHIIRQRILRGRQH